MSTLPEAHLAYSSCAQRKVTFLQSCIAGNEATDCTYSQWCAEAVVGLPQLDGHRINMHITFMHMHIEPRWQEVLAGMQEQWEHFLKQKQKGAGLSAPNTPRAGFIDHTESSWVLSEHSDEHRGMLKLMVNSRLYQALQKSVASGVEKLPIPNRPQQWRFRNEFHLSVLAC